MVANVNKQTVPSGKTCHNKELTKYRLTQQLAQQGVTAKLNIGWHSNWHSNNSKYRPAQHWWCHILIIALLIIILELIIISITTNNPDLTRSVHYRWDTWAHQAADIWCAGSIESCVHVKRWPLRSSSKLALWLPWVAKSKISLCTYCEPVNKLRQDSCLIKKKSAEAMG